MSLLDDTAIFAAVVKQGGFSHAAKYLGLSNGLISRRIAQLEAKLGVTLIIRTTRQIKLTPEGELLWQHAQRIQQELDSALSLIHSSANKPKGMIRLSAPPYFGRAYLTPLLAKFLKNFDDIHIDLRLSHSQLDPIKDQLDLTIRGAGYVDETLLKDSSMRMKSLLKEKIHLYASPAYLLKQGEPTTPDLLNQHAIIHYIDNKSRPEQITWSYGYKHKKAGVTLTSKFYSNDIESCLSMCAAGLGIGKFTELNAKKMVEQKLLQPILSTYAWGEYHLFALYSNQQALPKRTQLLLQFIYAHTQHLLEKSE